jgi:hypothetical protein
MKRMAFSLLLGVSFLISAHAADTTAEDKSQYTLFNPTPSELMRAWRTDRAGASPYTIDAGHFEVDLTVLGYGYDEHEILIVSGGFTTFARIRMGWLGESRAELSGHPERRIIPWQLLRRHR